MARDEKALYASARWAAQEREADRLLDLNEREGTPTTAEALERQMGRVTEALRLMFHVDVDDDG